MPWAEIAKYGLPALGSLWSAFTGSKAAGKQSQYNQMMANLAQEQMKMQQQQFGAEQPFREQLLQALTNRQNTAMPRFMAQGMQYSNPYQRVNRTGVPGTSGESSFRPNNVNLGGPNIAAALQMAEGRRGPAVTNPMLQQAAAAAAVPPGAVNSQSEGFTSPTGLNILGQPT